MDRPFAASALACAIAANPLPSPAQGQVGLPAAPKPVPGSLLDPGTLVSSPARPALRRVSTGTGFHVTVDGHIVTNHHVVDGCKRIARGDGAVVSTLAADRKHDLALLKGPPVTDAAHLRAGPDPRQGEDVLIYGFPLQGVLSSSGHLGAGMVSALAGLRDDPGQLQVDVPVQPGNSGGPLLDRRGQVVGVVVAKLNALRVAQMTGDIPQNINFAVKPGPVKALLEAHGVRYATGSASAPTLSNFEIADVARAFTTSIVCER